MFMSLTKSIFPIFYIPMHTFRCIVVIIKKGEIVGAF